MHVDKHKQSDKSDTHRICFSLLLLIQDILFLQKEYSSEREITSTIQDVTCNTFKLEQSAAPAFFAYICHSWVGAMAM